MRIELYDDSRRDRWEKLIEQSSDATLGHLWQWREAIRCAYGYKSFHLALEEPNGEPVAAIPFIWIRSRFYGTELASMPYIDYGAVCHRDSLSEETRERCDRVLYSHAIQLGRAIRAKRLHVRSPKPCDPRLELSTEKVTQHLPLARSSREQLPRLPTERRNRIRRCAKLGIVSEILPPEEGAAFGRFCDIYSSNMHDLGSPTHSPEFFRQVMRNFRDRISLIVIRQRAEIIASALAFEFRGSMSLPWSGATLAARPVYGSNALYWAAICLAIERGCHTFDFGRSSVGSGIFEFKRQWGPVPQQAYWSTFYFSAGAKAPRQRRELRMATTVWRRVPLAVTRALGPTLRKGISN
ncbi:MAG: GNAT family N-acetyltransferase [Candidatus Binataceae bacterium]